MAYGEWLPTAGVQVVSLLTYSFILQTVLGIYSEPRMVQGTGNINTTHKTDSAPTELSLETSSKASAVPLNRAVL